jgi:Lsr2
MQELIPAIWDDRHLAEQGIKVPAAATVTVGYQGQWYEMDLNSENANLLAAEIYVWTSIGRKTNHAPKPRSEAVAGKGRHSNAYYVELREWAAAQDPPVKIAQDAHGKYNYTPAVRQRYDDHLARQESADGTA